MVLITKPGLTSTNERAVPPHVIISQPMGGRPCPGVRAEDLSWSVSAWPATNIENNNNNADADQ